MRHWQAMLTVVAVAACADQPSTGPQRFAPSLSAIGSDGAPPLVYNTQMRSELEVPTSTSESKGHAQIKILAEGTIESVVIINKALMQSQGATSLTSAVRNVPGITIGAAEGSQIGNNINNFIFYRRGHIT